jgi:hypothetical protein
MTMSLCLGSVADLDLRPSCARVKDATSAAVSYINQFRGSAMVLSHVVNISVQPLAGDGSTQLSMLISLVDPGDSMVVRAYHTAVLLQQPPAVLVAYVERVEAPAAPVKSSCVNKHTRSRPCPGEPSVQACANFRLAQSLDRDGCYQCADPTSCATISISSLKSKSHPYTSASNMEGSRPVPLVSLSVLPIPSSSEIMGEISSIEANGIDFNDQTVQLGVGAMVLLLLFLLSCCCRGKRTSGKSDPSQAYKQVSLADRGSFDVPDDDDEDMINPFATDDDD